MKDEIAEPLPLHRDNGCYSGLQIQGQAQCCSQAGCLLEFCEDDETDRLLPECKFGFHNWCNDAWFMSCSTWLTCQTPVVSVEESRNGGLETSDQMVEGNIMQEEGSAREASNMEPRTSFACHSQMLADDIFMFLRFLLQ